MDRITVYQKPSCSTCRQVYGALKEAGVDFDAVNYYLEPLSATKLKSLLAKMKMKPADLLRSKEQAYKDLGLSKGGRTDEDLVALMVKHPDLIQRPIVEKGSRAVLARPAERLKDFLAEP